MSNKSTRGFEDNPNDSIDRPQGQRRDDSAEDDVVDEERDRAGAGQSPLEEYRFSDRNKVRRHSSASAEVVDEVYDAILDRLDGQSECYVKTSYLDCDQSNRVVGHAIGELAHAEDCPLDIEQWSDTGTRTHTWHVTVPDDPGPVGEIPSCPWCGEPGSVEDREDDLFVCDADNCILDSYQVPPGEELVADGGRDVSAVFSRLCELAIEDGDVPEDDSGLDGIWTRTVEARKRDRDWQVAVNADTEEDRDADEFPRDGDTVTIPSAGAVIYLGAWPAGLIGPHGGTIIVEQVDTEPRSLEDELLRDIETELLDAGAEIERTIPDQEVATDGGDA